MNRPANSTVIAAWRCGSMIQQILSRRPLRLVDVNKATLRNRSMAVRTARYGHRSSLVCTAQVHSELPLSLSVGAVL